MLRRIDWPVPRGRGWSFLLILCLILSACDKSGDAVSDSAASQSGGRLSALDDLAIATGAIGDPLSQSPSGAYGRDYEGGRDQLCMLPGQKKASYLFGAEIRIGGDEYCVGRGSARLLADKLIFSFDGGNCVIVARYEGDRVTMPGALDTACAALCNGRGSFAGTSFPRIANDLTRARRAVARDGKPLC